MNAGIAKLKSLLSMAIIMLPESESKELIIEYPHRVCVCCASTFNDEQLTFEQRLIEDESFCPTCFADIMNSAEYAADMPYQEYMEMR